MAADQLELEVGQLLLGVRQLLLEVRQLLLVEELQPQVKGVAAFFLQHS